MIAIGSAITKGCHFEIPLLLRYDQQPLPWHYRKKYWGPNNGRCEKHSSEPNTGLILGSLHTGLISGSQHELSKAMLEATEKVIGAPCTTANSSVLRYLLSSTEVDFQFLARDTGWICTYL